MAETATATIEPLPVGHGESAGAEPSPRLQQQVDAIVQRLERLAADQVSKRSSIEDRWYDDLRQYHGQYGGQTEDSLKRAGRSRIFVNLTRAKTHAWEARLADMLFPVDDRNWGIKPTPVPELTEGARRAAAEAQRLTDQANARAQQAEAAQQQGDAGQAAALAGQAEQVAAQADAQAREAARLEAETEEARRRAEAMQREIDDQFKEARYNIKARDAIHDGVKLGTGVMKGPLTGQSRRRGYLRQDGAFVLQQRDDPRPEWQRVDPWSFFPDMDARTLDEAEFTFERHLMGRKQLRRLARQPGFDAEAIRALLTEGPQANTPAYVNKLRDITGSGENVGRDLYVVWEYHGPLEREDLQAIMTAVGDAAGLEELEVDPLSELPVIVWICQGRLLKFAPHPLETGDSLYSVWNFERDDGGIFGYGVPALMRDSQRALNAAWRAMMDNAGLSAGPQVVVNKQAIEPADGNWRLTGLKLWLRNNSGGDANARPFETYDIPPNQQFYANIIELAGRFADVETSLPELAQGGDSTNGIERTAQGTAIVMNAANVVFRRIVRNWDDDMTVPNVRRAYDWNMQFNEREDIKGDFEVDARGSSVLLVRELQAQNLMAMLANFAAHPVLGPLTKAAPAYRKLVQAHHLSADDVVKSDEEIEAEQARQQEGPPPPEVVKAQTDREIAALKAEVDRERIQADLRRAQIERETELAKLAQESNMELEELEARLREAGMKTEAELRKTETQARSKERLFAAEAAIEERQARRGETAGSGGFIA